MDDRSSLWVAAESQTIYREPLVSDVHSHQVFLDLGSSISRFFFSRLVYLRLYLVYLLIWLTIHHSPLPLSLRHTSCSRKSIKVVIAKLLLVIVRISHRPAARSLEISSEPAACTLPCYHDVPRERAASRLECGCCVSTSIDARECRLEQRSRKPAQ